jgi:hypothetical protein
MVVVLKMRLIWENLADCKKPQSHQSAEAMPFLLISSIDQVGTDGYWQNAYFSRARTLFLAWAGRGISTSTYALHQ